MRTGKAKPFFVINARYIEYLHDSGIAITWPGLEPVKEYDCLDLNLLASAAEQPFQAGFGVEFYPTLFDKAACYFFLIAGGHIFGNGNKRTAVLVADQFMWANGYYLNLPNDTIRKNRGRNGFLQASRSEPQNRNCRTEHFDPKQQLPVQVYS